jgi:hypothetical protein
MYIPTYNPSPGHVVEAARLGALAHTLKVGVQRTALLDLFQLAVLGLQAV